MEDEKEAEDFQKEREEVQPKKKKRERNRNEWIREGQTIRRDAWVNEFDFCSIIFKQFIHILYLWKKKYRQ